MDTIKLTIRNETGTSAARRIRRDKRIPGVVYANGMEPVSVTVDQAEMLQIIRHHGDSALVAIQVDGGKIEAEQVIYKRIQTNSLNTAVLHVDFQAVRKGEKVSLRVPLHLTGSPIGVIDQGGILMKAQQEIMVRCIPSKIPDFIEFDVTHLELHQSTHLRDVPLPEGLDLDDNPDSVVANITMPSRAPVEEPKEGELLEGEEGEVPEGEGGEAKPGEAGKDEKKPGDAKKDAKKDDKKK